MIYDLDKMKSVDIRTAERTAFTEIGDLHITPNLQGEKRLSEMARQTDNFYCFRCEGALVKMSFPSSGKTLADLLVNHMLTTQV